MKPLSLNEIREKYLAFFESKGHLRMKSFPLIPQNDNTVLFVVAGMAPFKPYFRGDEIPPSPRIATCQKCIRTNDLENVGITPRHCSFFEMLGNFSFGDYFKDEIIPWAWEFLTQVLEIPAERLLVSVYEEDDEAYDIWIKNGVPAEKIFKLGKEDNFWEIGAGPCGPCSEIFYDRGAEYGCGKPGCDITCECGRYMEFWNLVFTQFDSDGKGNYTRLAKPNIDTGMGLERMTRIIQNTDTIFEIDTFKTIMDKLCEITETKYTKSMSQKDISLRIITEHIRSVIFLICDGILPSNEGRGYVLRRLIRRAARRGKLLGINDIFLVRLCDTVIEINKGAYPELGKRAEFIKKTIEAEENRFKQTLDTGLAILEKIIDKILKARGTTLSGKDVFKLYDTFGFPFDLTRELSVERGLEINEDEANALMEQQRKKAQEARSSAASDSANKAAELIDKNITSRFCGYENIKCVAEILAIVKDSELTSLINGGEGVIVLNQTPFYAESGGQVGDTGIISIASGSFRVTDTKKIGNKILHFGHMTYGELSLGIVNAEIDFERRKAIMRNHSSVHLLQSALRNVLGDHVRQAGSYVDEKRMRFDFTHINALNKTEILEIEHYVNSAILDGYDVSCAEKSMDEAVAEGALALFGEKYGETVRVVKMGDVSTELCGGTHVDNTAKIGLFKIISESSVAAGVRRIEALTGFNSLNSVHINEELINSLQTTLKAVSANDMEARAAAIINEMKQAKKMLENANVTSALNKIASSLENADAINGLRIVTVDFCDLSADVMRTAADSMLAKNPDVITIFASVNEGKIIFTAGCGEAALKKGADAGKILSQISPIVGGGGGGRPDRASSGGKILEKLPDAFKAVKEIVKKQTEV